MATTQARGYRDGEGNTRLLLAIVDCPINDLTEEITRMIKNKESLNVANSKGQTPLILAAEKGKGKIVKMLIDACAELDRTDAVGFTALNTAATTGTDEIVCMLVDAGAKIGVRDKRGRTAFMNAAFQDRPNAVARLGRAKADINEKDDNGNTALILAAMGNSIDAVRVLVKCDGIDLNAGDKESWWTAMMHAAQRQHTEILEILVNAGANPMLTNKPTGNSKTGSTALDIAYFMAYPSEIKILERAEKQWYNAKRIAQEEAQATRKERIAETLRSIDEEMEKELKRSGGGK